MDEIRLPRHLESRIERRWASRFGQILEVTKRPERTPSQYEPHLLGRHRPAWELWMSVARSSNVIVLRNGSRKSTR
jgi:hypothetical protein